MTKIIIPLAAALAMTAGTALASDPDKWDQRGADQVDNGMEASQEVLIEDGLDLGIDFEPTASIQTNATTKDEVEEPTDLRRYNR